MFVRNFLGYMLGWNSNDGRERAAGEPDPNGLPSNRDDVNTNGDGDLPDDKNPLKYFYDYLEAKKDQFDSQIKGWEAHYTDIKALADTRPCSQEHEECVLESGKLSKSTFALIKEKLKQAFESQDAYFKDKLAEAETDVATMKEHIDSLIKKFNESEDEQERREAAIHISHAQIYLLRELQDFMQTITQSFKSAVNVEQKAEAVAGLLISLLASTVLKMPVTYKPNIEEWYVNFLDRKSEFEQLAARTMIDDVASESIKAEQVAGAAAKADDKPRSRSGSPVPLRRSTEMFKPVVSGSVCGSVVASAMNDNNVLRTSPRK